MPHKRPDGTVQFSLKLPDGLRENVEDFAEDRMWSRSQAIVYLLERGVGRDGDVEIGADEQEDGGKQVVSAGTKEETIIESVEALAESDHDGNFSAAARASLARGLQAVSES